MTRKRRTAQYFSDLFPHTGQAFTDIISPRASLIRDINQMDMFEWQASIEADVLLIYAASHRQSEDMFSRPRFAERFMNLQEMYATMAGKTRTNERRNDNTPEWKGFLDRKLSDDELAGLDAWKPTAAQIWNSVDAAIQSGFRFTLSYNGKTKLASVTQIDNREKSKTAGYALSSADTDGALALKMALYKHYQVLNEDWDQLSDAAPRARRG